MKYFQVLQKRSNFVFSRKQSHVLFDYNFQSPVDVQISNHELKQKGIVKQMGKQEKVKQKLFRQIQVYSCISRHIQAHSGISRDNQAYSRIFRNYSGIFSTLCNPDIFRTLIYSESCHIQNQRHIQNPGISKTLAHSATETSPESWDIQNWRHTQNLSKHLRWSALRNN